ncbi:MAG: TonB-dependent receptor [Bacteroidales bacterium]|nr:TonB-dependent receptor [Bacteroidales bacterium]MCF8390289.1 TonB-dependent receptor [Bacteroidales bacterium]
MKHLLFLLTLLPLLAPAQQTHTLSGKVTDAETGEYLIGASVLVSELMTGAITNSYGFYSLTLPEGSYTISYSYIGYEKVDYKLVLSKNQVKNIEITPSPQTLDEVMVSSERSDKNISSTQIGVEKLNLIDIETIPVFFGEKDILKTIQLLPGISNSAEGSTGFNVRGGSMGQNLILLDEAPVYSSSHLLGFFSVFNSDALNDVTIYKGAIPANFGGRASSVLDISMNNGNSKKFSSSGGVGLVSSRLSLEGPIIKDKMSFIISGRRTYGDLVARLLFPGDIISDDTNFYFYDLNAKLNYTINDNNRIYLSGYFGKDVLELGDNIGTGWGNTTGTLRWNHLFNERLFSNTSLIYSNYDYGFMFGQNSLRLRSGIEDISLTEDATWYINPENTFKIGANIIYHKFLPGELKTGDTINFEVVRREKQGFEGAIYFQNEQKISSSLSANYGIRVSGFTQMGPGTFFEYNEANELIDSVYYRSGKAAFPYFGLGPRLALKYQNSSQSSVKLSYSRLEQYIHLLSNTTAGSPTDVWIPGSNNLKPLFVDLISAGYFRNFNNNSIETSVEVYYKNMSNTADYEDGADIIFNEHVESQILMGKGRSYGLELFVKKKYGKFSGWISYTLSRTENKIEGISSFEWYPVKYDKTHDLSLVSIYKISPRLSLSGVWTYATGNAVTFPSGKYILDNNPVPFYTERNGYRMPAYHRFDLSLSLAGKKRKKYESGWDFSIYNLYNRYNAYMITFRESETRIGTTEAVKLSLFGIVPSITYKFKF